MGPQTFQKLSKKVLHFSMVFFHRFLDRSWEPKSLKMSASCTRETHFHKIAFSDSDLFFEAKMMKKTVPKMEPTCLKKSMKKSSKHPYYMVAETASKHFEKTCLFWRVGIDLGCCRGVVVISFRRIFEEFRRIENSKIEN